MIVLIVLCYFLAAWMFAGVLGQPFAIGKPRKPVTAGLGLVSMLLGLSISVVLILSAVALAHAG